MGIAAITRRIGSCALAGILAMSMASGLVSATPDEAQAATIKMSAKAKTLTVGKTCTLKVKGTKAKVKWSSTNKKVATVSTKGKVKAKKMGAATIKAKVGKKTYTCKATVKPKINASKKTVNVGKTYKLKLTGAVGTVKWSSSNKKVATVGASTGTVKGIKAGTATVTAKIKNKKVATCKVTVKKVAASNVNNVNADTSKVTVYDQNGKIIQTYSTYGGVGWIQNSIAEDIDRLGEKNLAIKKPLHTDWLLATSLTEDQCPKGYFVDKACTKPLDPKTIQAGQSIYLKIGAHRLGTITKYKDVRMEDVYYGLFREGTIKCYAYTDKNDFDPKLYYSDGTPHEQLHVVSYDLSTRRWIDEGPQTRENMCMTNYGTAFASYLPMDYVACSDCGYEVTCLSNNIHHYGQPLAGFPDPREVDFPISMFVGNGTDYYTGETPYSDGTLKALNGAPHAVCSPGALLFEAQYSHHLDCRNFIKVDLQSRR